MKYRRELLNWIEGKLKTYPGNYEDYIVMRAENELVEQKQQEKQKSIV